MLTLIVDNIYTEIQGDLPYNHVKEVEKLLSFRPEGFLFSQAYNKWIFDKNGQKVRRVWDGYKRQFWKNTTKTYFPTGLVSIVINYFKNNNLLFNIKDNRNKPLQSLSICLHPDLKFRDYQDNVINVACDKTRGIISAATGSGKTKMSAGIIQKLNVKPCLFLVNSIDLLEQTIEAFHESLVDNNLNPIEIGQVGGGVIDIKDINVCTVQTLIRAIGEKYQKYDSDDTDDLTPIEQYAEDIKELISESKLVICDEIQDWRNETCQSISKALKSAYYKFGVSATAFRDQGDDLLIQACFGKKIAIVTASELIEHENKYLIRPDIKIVHIKGNKSKFKQWQSIYKDRVVDNDYYNGIVTNIANSFVQQNKTVLVLSQQIEHGQKLANNIEGCQYLSGKSQKQKRRQGILNLRNRDIKCISSSTIFDQGIDVSCLDVVLLAGQGKSKCRAMQRIGRITRPYTYPDGTKKEKAIAIDFRIYDKYLLDHSIEREKMYRTEPAYHIEHIEDL
jgi:superfamily II DNA or RNA helicase